MRNAFKNSQIKASRSRRSQQPYLRAEPSRAQVPLMPTGDGGGTCWLRYVLVFLLKKKNNKNLIPTQTPELMGHS